MGYSAKYHATSLVAVFLALAIGILIGAEFGGDALTNTRRDLEHSLTGNLQDARDRADELSGELARSDEFANRVYPALVRDRLSGRRIGVVALGDLPGETSSAIEDALGPTGARLVGVGVVREPVDLRALADDLSKTRFAASAPRPRHADRLRRRAGTADRPRRHPARARPRPSLLARERQLRRARRGHRRAPRARRDGRGAALQREPARIGADRRHRRHPHAGGRRRDLRPEPSSVSFFNGNDLSSVDDVELAAGQVATVFALLGAEGSFGVKGSADRLLPDLLPPVGRS